MTRWSLTAVSGLVLSAAFALASPSGRLAPRSNNSDYIDPKRPECPHSYDSIPAPQSQEIVNGPVIPMPATVLGGVFSLASNIPEFNDCQRIIIESGNRYGPLMSVFASDALGPTRFAKGDSTETRAIAAVQVLDYSRGYYYKPLGIGPLFNCLYLAGYTGHWQAKMVQMRDANTCQPTMNIGAITSTAPLAVIEAPSPPKFSHADDVPPAARWEWDGTNNVQFIGLRCGSAWCHVGPALPSGAPAFSAEPAYVSPEDATDRVRSVNGWYDSQRLAIVQNVDGVTETRVSGVTGWVFPAPNLARHRNVGDFATFVPVAYVALETASPTDPAVKYYKTRFNYDVVPHGAPLNRMTEIALCYGPWQTCRWSASGGAIVLPSCEGAGSLPSLIGSSERRWWARLSSRMSGSPLIRCVKRRTHDRMPDEGMPATARWRWVAYDETTWDFCVSGCCETDGHQ